MAVDGTNGCLRAFFKLKRRYPWLRVILSIGGGGKGSENFAIVAGDEIRMSRFVRSAQQLADEYHLDGFDSKFLCFMLIKEHLRLTQAKKKKIFFFLFSKLIGSIRVMQKKVTTISVYYQECARIFPSRAIYWPPHFQRESGHCATLTLALHKRISVQSI